MNSLIIIGALAFIYLLINLGMPRLPVDSSIKTYLLQPLMWGSLAFTAWRVGQNSTVKPAGKISWRGGFMMLAVAVGLVQIVLYMAGGVMTGFGNNPASLTATGILTNLIFAGSMLAAFEFSRAYLVGRLGRQQPFLAVASIALGFTVLSIPLSQMTGFNFRMESSNIILSSWLPLMCENLFATALALNAGAPAALAYRGILAAFWWFSPILPDLEWSLKGIIGAAAPLVGLVTANNHLAERRSHGKPRRRARAESLPAGWIVAALGCVLIVWFAVGVFPWKPTLVGSGSMSPYMKTGDVVMVEKVEPTAVKIGDIIVYRKTENNVTIDIMHRVVDTVSVAGTMCFVTKGDANNSPDAEPVDPLSVRGKVSLVVPKIGWISIAVKKFFSGT